jgi:hypothetical protein
MTESSLHGDGTIADWWSFSARHPLIPEGGTEACPVGFSLSHVFVFPFPPKSERRNVVLKPSQHRDRWDVDVWRNWIGSQCSQEGTFGAGGWANLFLQVLAIFVQR